MPGESLATGCPPDILKLIPWYPDDGLTDAERGAVEAHAACCPECRREIHGAFGETDLPADAPTAERVLSRVFDRIAEGTHPEPFASSLQPPPPLVVPSARRTPRRDRAARPGSWVAAAAAAIVGVLFLAPLVGRLLTAAPATYRTASAPPAAPRAAGPALDIVLRSDVTAAQLNAALRALEAELVAGPTSLGRYRLQLPAGADASVAATALRAPETGVASFAEPVP
jgi:hypothetical protein